MATLEKDRALVLYVPRKIYTFYSETRYRELTTAIEAVETAIEAVQQPLRQHIGVLGILFSPINEKKAGEMNEKIERVKTHLRENKKIYIAGATCLAVGVGSGLILSTQQIAVIDSFKLINWKSSHVSQTILVRRGHPGNIIRCEQTGELFASQNRAAEVMGIRRKDLTQHLNGTREHAGNYTFTKLGEAQAA